ncbi:MAG: hypothetical protein IPM83_15585 [Ignavibacteria bacterium]|nr:hypothetical protein [Ignavibacteria bacterium]
MDIISGTSRMKFPTSPVQTLINAVVDRYDLVRRYYSVKQRLLGLDEFRGYDRNAVVGSQEQQRGRGKQREIL